MASPARRTPSSPDRRGGAGAPGLHARSFRDGLRAVRLVHPFPTVLNALAAVALAAVALRGRPDAPLALRLMGTMLAVQSAVGVVNDCVDRDLDAATKPWKPIPAGLVSPRLAWVLGVLAAAVGIALGATLGGAACALSTAGMAVGLAYDLRLKRTAWSGLTYAVALPLVPIWVWTAAGRYRPALLWVIPIGLVLGASLQLVNTLPDLEGDGSHGVRGTAHRLGRRRALAAAWGGYLAAVLLAVTLGLALGHRQPLLFGGAVLALALLAVAISAWLLRRDTVALQFGWSVLAPGAGVLAVSWLAALR